MVKNFGDIQLGPASAFGAPAIDGTDPAVLRYSALPADHSVRVVPAVSATTEAISTWALGLDLFIPREASQPAGTFIGLLQTGDGDGDLFLRDNGDGTAGLGISGDYAGSVPFDEWVRVIVTVTVEDGDTILRKFLNGAPIGEQNLGVTDRWAIDPETGLRLFTDNDGETKPGLVSSLFFGPDVPGAEDTAAIVATLGGPQVFGFFPDQPTPGAVEIDFANEDVTPRYGDAAVILEGAGYRSPLAIGDSAIGFASQFGIEDPGGADIAVLDYAAYAPDEGLLVSLPAGAPDFSSYTAVWDIRVDDVEFGWHALLQTDVANAGDGELFIRADRGLGINGDYDGTVPTDAWARLAITVEDQGDGTAILSKYIDGAFVDSQTVDADRFTLSGADGFLLLTDDNNETSTGHLAHFGLVPEALSAAEIAALGTADADGPFAAPSGSAIRGQIGFDGYAPTVELGFADVAVTDRMAEAAAKADNPLADLLIAEGAEARTFDLADVFGADAGGFTVTSSDGAVVDARIDGSTLTLTFGSLGFADLTISAADPLGDAITDTLRVRVAGEGAYTIAILPDTQDYTSNPGITQTFANITQWMADNAATKNIGFVTHVGDIVQNARPSEFAIARNAMDILRDAGIPFSVLPGNHDIGDGGSANVRETPGYNDAFGTTYMSDDPTFGGVYDQEPDRYDNNYHLWTAPDGTGWIFLNLEFGPRDDVMRWADDVLTQFGDRKAMVLTHSYLNWDGRHDSLGAPLQGEGAGYDYGLRNDPRGAWDGEELWREVLSKHANVLFTAGGHIFGDGAETLVSYNDFGNPVFQFLVNYQNGVANETNGAGNSAQGGNGGNGAIRLVTVDPANDAFYTETYFTELDTYFTGFRDKPELDRDGLTGAYAGHQETYFGVDVGAREAQPLADAGDDQRIVPGEATATAVLSAQRTSDPNGDIERYEWVDADGQTIAVGETAEIDLPAGIHDITLAVTTGAGVTSQDDTRIIVATDDTYLVETFNDGDAVGWAPAEGGAPDLTAIGTDLGFALPSISGAAQIPLTLSFDSHWRPFDNQTGVVLLSFDGGAPTEILRYDSTTTNDTDQRNERVEIGFLAPTSATDLTLSWRMSEADNDWYWAIDTIELASDDGTVLLGEDFDSLSGDLRPAVDEGIPASTLGWSHTPPDGWTRTVDETTPPGTTEWRGWSFTTPEFWTSADQQARGEFTRGAGVIAVADPDEWDDFNGGSDAGDDFATTLSTPALSLLPVGGGDTDAVAAGVVRIGALSPNQGLLVTPEAAGSFETYTLIYDIYVASGQGVWTSLIQTDITNQSDGDLFIRQADAETGGIGISGDYTGPFTYDAWNRVAFTVAVDGTQQILSKYIDGTLVGTRAVDGDITDGSRWTLDADTGFLLFSDESNETSEVFVNAFAFTPEVLGDTQIQALGGVDVDGPLAAPRPAAAFQFSFDGALEALDFGSATIEAVRLGNDTGTPFFVKGTGASREPGDGLAAPEGALFDQSNGQDNLLVWQDGNWDDIALKASLRSLDDDTLGVVFRYRDAENHYLLTLNAQDNVRKLIKVQDGVAAELASETGGYTFNDDLDLHLWAIGDTIGVLLDGVPLFGGPVVDDTPLGAGTVGLYSSGQASTIFDDIVVAKPMLNAEAGPRQLLIDFDGDGKESVVLDGSLSTIPNADTQATWESAGGDTVDRLTVETVARSGRTTYELVLDDGTTIDTDTFVVDVAAGERLIAADQFEDGDFTGWRIVDTTELGGPADWAVDDGALVERSGAKSRELTWAGASNADVWQRGWSPHGDGVFALHKGTYALWDGADALEDYAIEAMIRVPTADGGVGFMLNWIDEDNYYKLEIDAHANLTTLVKVVDGYESYIGRVRATFTPDEEFHLRAERVDGKLQAWVDGHALFAEPLEDRDLGAGSAGLYAWGAAGARFDNAAIVDLSNPFSETPASPLGAFGINDLLVRQGSPATFNLAELFPGGKGFVVSTSNGEAVEAVIEDGVLTLTPGQLGHADVILGGTAVDGSPIEENFRAIVGGENAYSFAVVPDTQSYTSTGSPEVRALFGQMIDWLVEHKDALGIEHVIHVGDITDNNNEPQWLIAEDAMERLDGKIGYTLAVGNHDQAVGGSAADFTSLIDAYFTPEQLGVEGTYDGYPEPSLRNNYTTLTTPDGTPWLVLSLEFGAPDDVLRWASEVIEAHLDHRVIIDTHSYNGGDARVEPLTEPLTGENGGWGYGIRNDPRNVNDGEDIWRELVSKYPNITFTFNGHNFLDGAETVVSYAAGDNPVYQIFANYQNGISGEITGAGDPSLGGRGGNGAFRLVVMDPDNDRITTHTKFTGLDTYFERVDHQEVFEGVDLGTPETITLAKAGGLMIVAATGDTATVFLDPSASIGPEAGVTYAWFDAHGGKLGKTAGAPLAVQLGHGTHRLHLVATDLDGNESRDDKVVIVEAPDALLTETFDDGDLNGWFAPDAAAPMFSELGTDLGFALPSLGGAAQLPLTLSFDSHWRPFDNMTGQVLVSFDGGPETEILRFDSGNTNDTDQRNERVDVEFLAPASAETVTLTWRMSEADNDWYWAIDTIELASADGTVLLSEDFDGLAGGLQPAVDENIAPDILGWTHTPPDGWTRAVDPTTPPGTTEWRGWSFTTPEFWTSADQQAREEFTRGSGVIAVADPDEWDDFNGGSDAGDDFATTLSTPGISLAPAGGGSGEAEAAGVLRVDALPPTQALRVDPAASGTFDEYALIYDIYVADGQGGWSSFIQTDVANTNDAEYYLQQFTSETGGIGISGIYDGPFTYDAWNRVAFVVSLDDTAQVLSKYIDGTLVGTQTLDSDIGDGSRWRIDADTGFLLFAEPANFTSEVFVNAFTFTPDVLSGADIAGLGGADLDGPLAGTANGDAFQFSFDGALDALDFGSATIEPITLGTSDTSYLVKGSIFQNPNGEGEAALYAQTNGANEILVWGGDGAEAWSDYVYDLVIHPTDNDTVGAVFYWRDAANHYEISLDTQADERVLTKVQDGERIELARETGGYRHHAPQDLRIAVVDDTIIVTLDDQLLFDGPVTDPDPLDGGSVGLLSRFMDRVSFDDISVNPAVLGARALGDKAVDDTDGDGLATVSLTAAATISPRPVDLFEWIVGGVVVATGTTADLQLPAGETDVTLRVTDNDGSVAEDAITIDVTPASALLLNEDFEVDTLPAGWTIVDDGTENAPSDWTVDAGRLVQRSDIGSGQQGPGFGAWSLGGEGAYILRDGTHALYQGPGAFEWTDYAVEATIASPDDDGLGLLFRYVDADNYYKLELDDEVGVIQLIRLENGYETVLARAWAQYAPDEAMRWKVTVDGGAITAEIDGVPVFGSEIDDRTHASGTIGLYAWNNAGVSFDDIVVTTLEKTARTVFGTEGPDLFDGSAGGDSYNGLGGNDVISGNGGDDTLIGGEGGDQIAGGLGDNLLAGDGTRIALVGEDAAYDSILGYLNPETKAATVVLPNTGNAEGFTADLALEADLVWFLIPNGHAYNPRIEAGGGYELVGDAATGYAIVDADGTPLITRLGGKIKAGAYFSDATLNPDGKEHVRLEADGTMAWEDLWNLGDADFNDVVVRLTDLPGGADTFVLAADNGTDTIIDFTQGEDRLGLANGLDFAALGFAGEAIIAGDETLAILAGVDATKLTEADFVVL